MILVGSEEIEAHRAAGLWGRRTLDSLLEFQAEARPDRIALLDAPDRERWTAGPARRLTWAQAAAEVARLAGALRDLGLGPDCVVGTQLANTADSLLLMLAALRAGLVLAPLPLQWRAAEVVEALAPLAPRALVGASRIGRTASAEILAEAAAGMFSVRHVAVLDREAPDGITSLSDFEAPSGLDLSGSQDPNHVASIAWDRGGLAARSHNQWIANGFMILLAARMGAGSRILSPLLPSNSAALAGAAAPWLLTGSTLILQHPFDGGCFSSVLAAERPTHVLLPDQICRALGSAISGMDPHATLIRVRSATDTLLAHTGPTLDLLRLGEAACLPVEPAEMPRLPLGPVTVGANGPAFCELRLGDENRAGAWPLRIRGPVASSYAASLLGPVSSGAWRDTGWDARATADGRLEAMKAADLARYPEKRSVELSAKAA